MIGFPLNRPILFQSPVRNAFSVSFSTITVFCSVFSSKPLSLFRIPVKRSVFVHFSLKFHSKANFHLKALFKFSFSLSCSILFHFHSKSSNFVAFSTQTAFFIPKLFFIRSFVQKLCFCFIFNLHGFIFLNSNENQIYVTFFTRKLYFRSVFQSAARLRLFFVVLFLLVFQHKRFFCSEF